MSRTTEAPVAVCCGSCGSSFALSARRARAHRAEGAEPVCSDCRRRPREPSAAERERLKAWWLARYSLQELRELADGLGVILDG